MRKILSLFAAMLVTLAVNAQTPSTDFLSGYTFTGANAVLAGSIWYNSEGNYLYYGDTSDKGTATWSIHATNTSLCAISVAVNIGASESGHVYKVSIFNSNDELVGSVEEPTTSWAGSQSVGLPDVIMLPGAGDYSVVLYNLEPWSSSIVQSVTLTGKSVPSTDFVTPGQVFGAADASLAGDIWYNANGYLYGDGGSHQNYGTAEWVVNATRACYVTVTLNLTNDVPSGHNFAVEIFDVNNASKGTVSEGGESWETTAKQLSGRILIPAAGIYRIVLSNSVEWSSASISGVTLSADVFSVAGNMNDWSTFANPMTLVGEDLYMAEINLGGENEFKIVKNNATWYGADKINSLLSDVKMTGDNNISINLPASGLVKFYWDAANDKVYLTLNPATITCTVAGAADLVGVNWDPSAVANDMTNNGDSTFTLIKEDVTLNVGDHGYKVAYNHNWDVSFGDAEGNNAIVNITEAGIYDVTFSFNWKTKEVSALAVLQEPVVIIPVVKLTGNFTNPAWDAESAITLVDNGDGTCSVTKHFAVDVISFKLIVDGNWYADENHSMMTRGNQGEGWEIAYDTGLDNTQLDVDMEGDYVFTYTYATRKLLVTYPLIVREATNANYQSLCTPYDATLDGATAYTVGAASESGVTLNPVVGNLEAGHSYIIKPTEIGTVTVNFVAEGTSTTTPVYPNGTGLYGVLVNNYVYNYATEKGKAWVNVFVLLNDNMFHQVIAGGEVTITPTHAYLHIEGQEIVPNPGAPGIRIIENATNIENIEGNETAVKFIENGKLFIKKNGVVYDATGAVVK